MTPTKPKSPAEIAAENIMGAIPYDTEKYIAIINEALAEEREEHATEPQEAQVDVIEECARIEHERWSGWQQYLHECCTLNGDGSLTIPIEKVIHWTKLIATPYADLPEHSKEMDRKEARKYAHFLKPQEARQEGEIDFTEAQADKIATAFCRAAKYAGFKQNHMDYRWFYYVLMSCNPQPPQDKDGGK